jgi:enediyne biosynthesis protein E4
MKDQRHFIEILASIIIMHALLFLSGCQEKNRNRFERQDPNETGITFTNRVEENAKFNVLTYEYMYNGGGVAAGDFNNDGLQDLYFTANQGDNALYLNRGDWEFEDITAGAGVKGKEGWKTGVTTVDINGDGFLDIYVCYSGPGSDRDRSNQLFINDGKAVPTFTDEARAYGLDAPGTFSTQASFFDFDRDGDLDMFLLNHAKITYSPFYNTRRLRGLRHPRYGNRLYKNENGLFRDVSEKAGIHGSGINFGLGVSVSDVNDDGWPDIYVTNDYEEQDYFYLNNRDGTFSERLKESFRHISRSAMGSDIADFNNDALPDVFVADMLPEDNYRQKLLKGPDEFDKYNLLRDSGYHHQNMRNMLQLNLGTKQDGAPVFSEIGQLAGVSNTDWSWAPLFVDLDNDGFKDLFVTNGYRRDYTNMDFLKYMFTDYSNQSRKEGKALDTLSLIAKMPESALPNYCFLNNRNLTFKNVSSDWGFSDKGVTNGATYVDLDNDGDQDIVTNNMNEACGVYRNNSESLQQNHYVKIRFKNADGNTSGIGAKVTIVTAGVTQMQELYPTRGYQSSVPHELLFGVGANTLIDKVTVIWMGQELAGVVSIKADTLITIPIGKALRDSSNTISKSKDMLFQEVAGSIHFKHQENAFIDYKFQYLLPFQLSSNGPCLAKGDVNLDGFDDIYVGGARGQSGKLFLSTSNGGFVSAGDEPWVADKESEDTDAVFFDADGDQDLDLYVVSGSAEYLQDDNVFLRDRLYLNLGAGKFIKSTDVIPAEKSNGSFVIAGDYDNDNDLDLFVGGKSLPGYFPLPAYSFLFRNDTELGVVKFTDATPEFLKKRFMLSSGVWSDYDQDGWKDLVLLGEFAPVCIIRNVKGALLENNCTELESSGGLWSRIVAADIDYDGDEDFIAGNAGLNAQWKVSAAEPMTIHYHDFNTDGKIDPILSYFIQGTSCVYPSRDEMLEQLPHLKKKFQSYTQYANAHLNDLLDDDQRSQAKIISAQQLQTCLIRNTGGGKFKISTLPVEAQLSRVNGILVDDFTGDGIADILLAGNFFPYRVQLGRSDAASGLLLAGDKQGNFSPRLYRETGFLADGDVRSMIKVHGRNEDLILCGVNDSDLKFFKIIYR